MSQTFLYYKNQTLQKRTSKRVPRPNQGHKLFLQLESDPHERDDLYSISEEFWRKSETLREEKKHVLTETQEFPKNFKLKRVPWKNQIAG